MGAILNRRFSWEYACDNVYVTDYENPAEEIQRALNMRAQEGWRIVQYEQYLKGCYLITFEREWEEDN